MAIRGIDAQIMVTRTAEFSKDAVAQLKRNELLQDYLTVQSKETDMREAETVQRTPESEHMALHPDRDGGTQFAEARSGERDADKNEEASAEDENEDVGFAPEKHILDIEI
jgi:hypothetical protein